MNIASQQAFNLKHRDKFYIGGKWVSPSTSALIDVVNPSTEEVAFQVADAEASDMDRAVTAARIAFDEGPWPHLTHAERADYLRKIAVAVRNRAEEFAALSTGQMGVLYREAVFATLWSADRFEYYADRAEDFPFIERHVPMDGGKVGLLVREPVGVVAAIVPWNSGLTLIAAKLAPALLAGCAAILKASPEAPGEAYLIAEVFEEVGLPAGVVNMLTAGREVSELLVRDARVDKVSFTGSTMAGRKVASIAGQRIARCSLELGGKSAAIILDDYDIVTAAQTLAASGARMTGQVCASLTRIIVSRQRHDAFVDALSGIFSGIKVGDPFDDETGMGPLVSKRQRESVERYLAIGKREGKLATGGGRPEHLDRGFFVDPTVFANVDNSAVIAQEEIFGPVLSVIAADDEAHAVKMANDSIYGLNASVFSNDVEHVYHVARRLQSGTVGHNGFRGDFGIAFGGFKQSGIGREGGREGIQPFVELKTIILEGEVTTPGVRESILTAA